MKNNFFIKNVKKSGIFRIVARPQSFDKLFKIFDTYQERLTDRIFDTYQERLADRIFDTYQCLRTIIMIK